MRCGIQYDNARRQGPRRFASLILLLGAVTCASSFAIAATNPFLASQQSDSSDISAFTKWTGLAPRYEAQRAAAATECIGKACLNKQWEQLLGDLEHASIYQQMKAINQFFNRMDYVADQDNYGVSDYWQTPYELMERGGDCEDYAVAKYLSLRRLGVPEKDLRIIVVRDEKLGGTIHAVLEVKVNGIVNILDNQNKSVLSVSNVYHYKPMFAINESKWWSYK